VHPIVEGKEDAPAQASGNGAGAFSPWDVAAPQEKAFSPYDAIRQTPGGSVPGRVLAKPAPDPQNGHIYCRFESSIDHSHSWVLIDETIRVPDQEPDQVIVTDGTSTGGPADEVEPIHPLDTALLYASLGWPVVPLHAPTGDQKRPCSCRKTDCPQKGSHPCHSNTCSQRGKHACHQSICDSVGKHPRTKNGVDDATTDEAIIRKWWDMWPEANVGLATGDNCQDKDEHLCHSDACSQKGKHPCHQKGGGFFVPDVDPRNGGDRTLAVLEAKHGKLPETRIQDTGGDGFHLLFKYPDFKVKNDSKGVLGQGLDIKSNGGLIVAAPSPHVSGKRYRWRNNAPITEAPEWLLKLIREKERKISVNGSGEVGEIIPEGARHPQLLRWAGQMRYNGLSGDAILAALRIENDTRCNPPKDDSELVKIADWVSQKQPNQAEEPEYDSDTSPDLPEPPDWPDLPEWGTRQLSILVILSTVQAINKRHPKSGNSQRPSTSTSYLNFRSMLSLIGCAPTQKGWPPPRRRLLIWPQCLV
jgi:Bifunctional DNA primase/polymerase, N-terminal/Primase C terminal 1 (PriCT-1)